MHLVDVIHCIYLNFVLFVDIFLVPVEMPLFTFLLIILAVMKILKYRYSDFVAS